LAEQTQLECLAEQTQLECLAEQTQLECLAEQTQLSPIAPIFPLNSVDNLLTRGEGQKPAILNATNRS
jgi:hypothetical protein